MIHVPEEGHDRRTRTELLQIVLPVELCQQLFLGRNRLTEVGLNAQGHRQQFGRLPVDARRDNRRCANSMSFDMTCVAGTPRASEKLRTVTGSSTTTWLLRGAAVEVPDRLARNRGRLTGLTSSSSDPGPRTPVVRFRLSCRCSRPKNAEPPDPSSVSPAPRPPRRLSLSNSSAASSSLVRSLAAPAFLGCRAAFRFCSCFLRCSERGFPPAFDARIASRGSLRSGFCGAGSLGFLGAAGPFAAGIGAEADRRSRPQRRPRA